MIGFGVTEPEAQIIVRALRVAAEVYRKDAEAFPGNARMRDGFMKQAQEAEDLAESLEDRNVVQLTKRELSSW